MSDVLKKLEKIVKGHLHQESNLAILLMRVYLTEVVKIFRPRKPRLSVQFPSVPGRGQEVIHWSNTNNL